MSAISDLTLKDISIRLFKANAIKFGHITTQSGNVTPVYFDLRVIVSYPELMKDLSTLLSDRVNALVEEIRKNDPATTNRVLLCGVPYTAVPITTLISVKTNIPMIFKRKEAKSYGTGQLIEGVWKPGDTCVLVDDVIMFGDSILETADDLVDAGLLCSEVVVLLDRQQGAIEKVGKKGIKVHPLLTLTEIMTYLLEGNYVTADTCSMVKDYLKTNQISDLFSNGVCNNESKKK